MATAVATERITDYARFLSKRAKLRKPSPIRALQPLVGLPGMVRACIKLALPHTLLLTNISDSVIDFSWFWHAQPLALPHFRDANQPYNWRDRRHLWQASHDGFAVFCQRTSFLSAIY